MAIKAEERQVGTQPSGRLIREFRTQLPTPNLPGVQNFAGVLGDIGEKEVIRSAKEEATAYANSLEFGRDEKGNFVKPVAPEEFGPIRREVFNDLINRRYVTDVLLDHDAAVADIYAKNKAAGGDPGTAFAKAQADMTGRLAGVDPANRAVIEQAMRKNLIQYNTGAVSQHYAQVWRSEYVNHENQIAVLSDRYVRAIAANNPADGKLALDEIVSRRDKLKTAGYLTQDPDADRIFFSSLEAQSRVSRQLNIAVNDPNLDRAAYPAELNRLQRIVKGEAADDETAFGFKSIDFKDIDRATANRITQDLSQTETKFRQQYAVSAQMQKIQTILSETASGNRNSMYSATPEIQVMAIQQHMLNFNKTQREMGRPEILDISSPEGLMEITRQFGIIPAKLFDGIFTNISTRSPQDVERASTVLRNIRTLPDQSGLGSASQEANFGSAEDRNFLDHYISFRTAGFEPDLAITSTRKVLDDRRAEIAAKGSEEVALQQYRVFKNNDASKTMKDLYDDVKKRTGIEISKLPPDVREQFSKSLPNSIALAQSFEQGVINAGQWFKQNYTIDPTRTENASQFYRDNAYIPKGEAFPLPSDGRSQPVSNWFTPYLGPLLSKYAKQGVDASRKNVEGTIEIAGISKPIEISSLEVGKNIFFKNTGQATYNPSVPWHQQDQVNPTFHILYYDPKVSMFPIPIRQRPTADNPTGLLTFEPHAEAKAQHDAFVSASVANNTRLNQFDRNDAILRQQRLRTQAAALAGREQDIPTSPLVTLRNIPEPVKPVMYGPNGKAIVTESTPDRLVTPGDIRNLRQSIDLYRAPDVDNLVAPKLRDSLQRLQQRSSFDASGTPPAEFVNGGPVLLANKQTVQLTSKDRDLLIRTVMAEAGSEPAEGKAGVAYVVLNRLASGRFGNDVYSILTKKDQFEPWTKNPEKVMAYTPSTPGWKQAAAIVDTMIAGGVSDPTNGATHFANRDIVEARKNIRALRWIDTMSNPTKIGRHTFGSAGGEGAG